MIRAVSFHHRARNQLFSACIPYSGSRSTSSTSKSDDGSNVSPLALKYPTLSSSLPASTLPYLELMRIDKQVGTMLLLWPCWWSTSLAAPIGSLPDIGLLSKFAIGAFIMRSAGCTINDLWDKEFDKHVERTKMRPLARGAITTKQAIMFLGLQLSGGLTVLLSLPNLYYSVQLGFASMPLVVMYPLMKRYTYFPQLVLGLTFNWGALMGWAALHGSLDLAKILPLYMSGVCWTLVYDTLYGYQDRKDDKKLGLKSTSLYLGDQPQWPLTGIATGMIGGLLLTGINNDLSSNFYLGTALVSGQTMWQIWTADINDEKNLWKRFDSNKYTGAAIMASIIAGHF